MSELPWIAEARSHIGLREIPGARHAPEIIKMLDAMSGFGDAHKAWWRDDETAWCGTFLGYCLGKSGRYVIPSWYRAMAWASNSNLTRLSKPAYGCIVVFSRRGGGHVGFVVGEDSHGNLMVLGGNQSNAVNIKPFSKSRVRGYYWPAHWISSKAIPSWPYAIRYSLPRLNSNGEVSTNEQ